jgi:hypothetical protein
MLLLSFCMLTFRKSNGPDSISDAVVMNAERWEKRRRGNRDSPAIPRALTSSGREP